jgi:hypothetical protein
VFLNCTGGCYKEDMQYEGIRENLTVHILSTARQAKTRFVQKLPKHRNRVESKDKWIIDMDKQKLENLAC